MSKVTIDRKPPLVYWMVEFDKHGNEVPGSDGLASEAILEQLRTGDVTDILIVSHGWKSSWERARADYEAWISGVADAKPKSMSRPFRPLIIGVHWPSQWFVPRGAKRGGGTRTLGEDDAQLAGDGSPLPLASIDELEQEYVEIFGDSDEVREAIRIALEAEAEGRRLEDAPEAAAAMQSLRDYVELEEPELRADADEPEGASGETRMLGGGPIGWASDLLRQFSFWTMKRRAYTVGASGIAHLVRSVQQAGGKDVRVHLMGHSFGCIVVSSAVYAEGKPPRRPFSSLLLVQGALSLWAFADNVLGKGKRGLLWPIRDPRYVAGPIVATQSRHDQALSFWYPKGVMAAGAIPGGWDHEVLATDLSEQRWGAVGTFGIQGASAKPLKIENLTTRTRFSPGVIYNVESSSAIVREDGGDAHSSIVSPATGRLAWRVMVSAP